MFYFGDFTGRFLVRTSSVALSVAVFGPIVLLDTLAWAWALGVGIWTGLKLGIIVGGGIGVILGMVGRREARMQLWSIEMSDHRVSLMVPGLSPLALWDWVPASSRGGYVWLRGSVGTQPVAPLLLIGAVGTMIGVFRIVF